MSLLFRNSSKLAADLLKHLDADVPKYTEARVESSDLTDLKPAEYRADQVLLLMREGQPVTGIVVEVQLHIDKDKQYVWPAYVTNLRSRIRCPVYLLVVTTEVVVEGWARNPIELGGGSRIVPWVVGPKNAPAITDLHQAEQDLELSILSAQLYASSGNIQLAARIASTAIVASASVDAERCGMYLDLILRTLSESALQELRAMNPAAFEYMSDFACHYIAKGKAEGKAEGVAEGKTQVILRLLTSRFGPVTETIQTLVRVACKEQPNGVPDGVFTAKTLEGALEALQAR